MNLQQGRRKGHSDSKELVQMLSTHIYKAKQRPPAATESCTAFIHGVTEEALLSLQEFYLLEAPHLVGVTFKEAQRKERIPKLKKKKKNLRFQCRKIKQMSAVLWESSVKLNNADGMAVCNYDSI